MRSSRIVRVLAAVLLTMSLSACEQGRVAEPELDAQFSSAGSNRSNGNGKRASRQVERVSSESGVARGDANRGHSLTLSVGGTTLFVPTGAVRQATDFSMTVQPGSYFAIELTATKRASSSLNDVGQRGFAKPLTLCLSRSDANITDASAVSIAEMVNGQFLKVPTTVTPSHVCGELRHFSGYTMVED